MGTFDRKLPVIGPSEEKRVHFVHTKLFSADERCVFQCFGKEWILCMAVSGSNVQAENTKMHNQYTHVYFQLHTSQLLFLNIALNFVV